MFITQVEKMKGILWPIFALIFDCPVLSVCHSYMFATGARLMCERIDWHRASNHPTLYLFNCAGNNQDRIMQNDRG